MAHYVLSDVHGEADRFHRLLDMIQFSDTDTLYILGDVVDRGPEGIALLREIMDTPNMEMLLGNHEYMMLQYLAPGATETEIRRWNRNGNAPTLEAFRKLGQGEQRQLLSYLEGLPTYLEVLINGEFFHLVHGFPGSNTHDRVWGRPNLQTRNPLPDRRLIIGHTPVINLIQPEDRQLQYALELERRGDHLRICHAPGFLDIDCGCGHKLPVKALACLRLEDMEEFYDG